MRLAYIVIVDDDKPAVIQPVADVYTAQEVLAMCARARMEAVAEYIDTRIMKPVREGPADVRLG